jgi:hypothetical protein
VIEGQPGADFVILERKAKNQPETQASDTYIPLTDLYTGTEAGKDQTSVLYNITG